MSVVSLSDVTGFIKSFVPERGRSIPYRTHAAALAALSLMFCYDPYQAARFSLTYVCGVVAWHHSQPDIGVEFLPARLPDRAAPVVAPVRAEPSGVRKQRIKQHEDVITGEEIPSFLHIRLGDHDYNICSLIKTLFTEGDLIDPIRRTRLSAEQENLICGQLGIPRDSLTRIMNESRGQVQALENEFRAQADRDVEALQFEDGADPDEIAHRVEETTDLASRKKNFRFDTSCDLLIQRLPIGYRDYLAAYLHRSNIDQA